MKRIVTVVALLIYWSGGGLAQTARGGLNGTVTLVDVAVAGATVQAKLASGRVFTATTNKSGQFSFADLPAGTYEVSVPQLGIAASRFVQSDVAIAEGKATTLNISMKQSGQGILGDDNGFLAIHNKSVDVRGPAPRTRDGRPDLSGIWNVNVDANPEAVAMLPWADDVVKERRATNMRDLPSAHCLPDDPTPTLPVLRKIVQTPTLVVELFEQDPHYRQIFVDGRAHPKDLDPTWMGHSIGKWDKETFVVDTVGFNDKSWIIFSAGLPHTEMLHMIERYRRPDRGHLSVDLTVEDPGTFSKPIDRHMTWLLAPGEEILESVCTENNKFERNAAVQ